MAMSIDLFISASTDFGFGILNDIDGDFIQVSG